MAQARKKHQGAWLTLVVGIGVVIALFAFDGLYPALLNLLELKTFDVRLYARGTHKPSGLDRRQEYRRFRPMALAAHRSGAASRRSEAVQGGGGRFRHGLQRTRRYRP
jgi:hypothetical protein